jgi:hypothetical protein
VINSSSIQHRGKGVVACVGSDFAADGAFRQYALTLDLDHNCLTIVQDADAVSIGAMDVALLMAQHPVGQQLLRQIATGEMPQNYEAEADLS